MVSQHWLIQYVIWFVGHAAVLGAVLVFALRRRAAKPKAARLVFIALGVEGLQWCLRLFEAFVKVFWPYEHFGSPSWSNPVFVYEVSMQLAHAAFDIASWSLLAWAALVRPDEARALR